VIINELTGVLTDFCAVSSADRERPRRFAADHEIQFS
jgi:hypothetical protein